MKKPNLDTLTTFTNVDILTENGIQINSSITISENQIHSIGEIHGKEVSLPGYTILPGMINSHTHSPMNFLKDLCHGQKNMIENIFFKTESQLTSELTENLSYAYILSGLKSGVTSFVEHYYFIEGISNAFEKVGLRAFVGETLADLGGAFPSSDTLKKFDNLIDRWNYSSRIKPVICPHAADTVSPNYAKDIAIYAKKNNLPLHFHLAQRKSELDLLKAKFGKTPVELAKEWGWLTNRSLAVHLLHVTDNDIQILKDTETTVVSCPSSQILYEFLAPIDKFYQAGIPIALGTDCAASNDQADILSELKILALMMRDRGVEGENLYKNLFMSVTQNPARVLDPNLGVLKSGNLADMVFVKQSLDTLPMRDIWTHILFSYDSQHVDHVMVDGKFVLYDKKLCFVDEEELLKKFNLGLSKIQI